MRRGLGDTPLVAALAARGLHTSRHACRAASTPFGRYPPLPASAAMTAYPAPRLVPVGIPRPAYVPANFFTAPIWEHDAPAEAPDAGMRGPRVPIALGTDDERGVRAAGRLASSVLAALGPLVQPGVTTDELDAAAHDMIVAAGAYPSPLGYAAFPRSITTSVNNVIAHARPLEPTDMVNLDVTVYLDGFHGDTSATFCLADTDEPGLALAGATRDALHAAIAACGPGVPFAEIGRVIERIARREGLSVNRQFTGHGIGRRFHLPPYILHHENSESGTMGPGDCFTIEPPLVQGGVARGVLWDDGWTVATEYEHQLLVTPDGVDVLTA